MKITIITPWHNHPELIPAYEQAVKGAQVVIVDNGSDEETQTALIEMCDRLQTTSYVRDMENSGYAKANNSGMYFADDGIVIFLNNDIRAFGDWLPLLEHLKPGALYSPSAGMRLVDGIPVMYLEGWCLIGHKADFERIGGWKDDWEGYYWEDNELCWRASRAGLALKTIDLPLVHLSNYTSSRTPGAYDRSEANRAEFERIVREDRNAL